MVLSAQHPIYILPGAGGPREAEFLRITFMSYLPSSISHNASDDDFHFWFLDTQSLRFRARSLLKSSCSRPQISIFINIQGPTLPSCAVWKFCHLPKLTCHCTDSFKTLLHTQIPFRTMRVLISGVGVAGPVVAFWLAKAGARITLVEKAPALLSHGQNIDVQGTAIAIIKKMGLMDQLRRLNTTENGTNLVDAEGRRLASFPVQPGKALSGTSEFEILRGDLARILYEPTRHNPNVTYLFGTTVRKILSNDQRSVKVELSSGSVEEYDVLVAADGQWSRIRAQNFPPEDLRIVDTNIYAAYFTIPRRPDDDGWWNCHIATGARIVTTRPDPHGTYRGAFTRLPRGAAQKREWQAASRGDRKMQQELVRRDFADAGWQAPRLLDAMAQAPDFYFQALQQIRMSKWYNNRIVLVGDAAHCPTPLTGMGTSLAINGAYVLAGELSKLEDGEHPVKALEAYDNNFRPWVEEQQKISTIFPGAVHPETRFQRWLLQNFIWILSQLVKVPWIASWTGHGKSDEIEDFRVPDYPRFADSEYRRY